MPIASANGLRLYYESAGPVEAPVVLLVMGLATQHIAWPDAFVDRLVGAGLRVVRFDNRDVGLSTHCTGAPAINPLWAIAAQRLHLPFPLAYSLTDMAADAVGLLDALGIARAHVVGASMGGMIAQLVAARWPERVETLVSIMSSSGARGLPGPTPVVRRRMLRRPAASASRAEVVQSTVELLELISYPDPARESGAFQAMAEKAYDRSYDPVGARRQLLAIIADGSRVERLQAITAPTLVIHGAADPLVSPEASRSIAANVPGARLAIVDGMAHDLPPSRIGEVADLVVDHVHGRQ